MLEVKLVDKLQQLEGHKNANNKDEPKFIYDCIQKATQIFKNMSVLYAMKSKTLCATNDDELFGRSGHQRDMTSN